MDKQGIDIWAREFAAALCVGDERVPLDRVIALHLDEFESLRKHGLTWRGIAGILTRAGARRKDGSPISPDQLRADVSRLLQRKAPAKTTELPGETSSLPQRRKLPAPKPPRKVKAAPIRLPSPKPSSAPTGLKDVTEAEIAAAIAKISLK